MFVNEIEKQVEVFKTNIRSLRKANKIILDLNNLCPHAIVSFDLEDRDKILRVEDKEIDNDAIISLLKTQGYDCAVLED